MVIRPRTIVRTVKNPHFQELPFICLVFSFASVFLAFMLSLFTLASIFVNFGVRLSITSSLIKLLLSLRLWECLELISCRSWCMVISVLALSILLIVILVVCVDLEVSRSMLEDSTITVSRFSVAVLFVLHPENRKNKQLTTKRIIVNFLMFQDKFSVFVYLGANL